MIINYKTILTEKKQLTGDVYLYRFKLVEPSSLIFTPGQYLILFVPKEKSDPVRRLYSIASANTLTNEFELLIKLIPNGCASTYLKILTIENEVRFQGPAGMFTLRESPRGKIALVTGTGFAPLRSMFLSQLLTAEFTLFLGVPTYKDVFLFEELKSFTFHAPRFTFYICLSREQNLNMVPDEDKKYFILGRVTNGFEQKFQVSNFRFQDFDFYLCSAREIVESLKQYLFQKGALKEQVYFEKF